MTSISSIRGMPPARAIIHYLTTSHVFPAHLSHPDVQRTIRVRQAGGGVEVQRRLVKFLTDGSKSSSTRPTSQLDITNLFARVETRNFASF